jgi:hypothetical protein
VPLSAGAPDMDGPFYNMIATTGLILIVYGLMARRKYKYTFSKP